MEPFSRYTKIKKLKLSLTESNQASEQLLQTEKIVDTENVFITEYPELEEIQKDHQSPTPGPAQDSPKSHTMCLEHCPKAS